MESMKLHLIFTFLSVAVLASHAALPSVVYWNSMLPQTPMPKVVQQLLHNEWMEEKSTSVGVGKGGVNVNTGKGKPGSVKNGNPRTNVGVGKGGVVVRAGPKGKRVYVGVTPGPSPFLYNYAATEDQLHDSTNVALFFTEKDLNPGSTMNLHFAKTTSTTPAAPSSFLPRKVSESIPFSTQYIPEIYQKFSVAPESKEAVIIKKTLTECEEPGIKGEEKYCATSLESMIDFTISKLGNNVKAVTTEAEKGTAQKYRVVGVKKVTNDDDKAVVCHKLNYAYAVFYCHKTEKTEAFEVSLVGADGTKVKAATVCHKDTSEWNPKHLAFQVLKVKPGSVPVCHFLPEDHIVWVTN